MLQLLSVPQSHQANSRNLNTEGMVQAHAGPMLAGSVSVSPYESCLVDLTGRALLVSLPTLIPTMFSPRLLQGSPASEGRGLMDSSA